MTGGHTATAADNAWYRARGYRFVAMDGTSGLNRLPVRVTR